MDRGCMTAHGRKGDTRLGSRNNVAWTFQPQTSLKCLYLYIWEQNFVQFSQGGSPCHICSERIRVVSVLCWGWSVQPCFRAFVLLGPLLRRLCLHWITWPVLHVILGDNLAPYLKSEYPLFLLLRSLPVTRQTCFTCDEPHVSLSLCSSADTSVCFTFPST